MTVHADLEVWQTEDFDRLAGITPGSFCRSNRFFTIGRRKAC